MSMLPNRDELDNWSYPKPEPHAFDPEPEDLPPEEYLFKDMEDLRAIAKDSSRRAMMTIIMAMKPGSNVSTQQFKAAETVLEIAFGKQKDELRTENTKEDAFRTMQDLIRQAKEQ